MCVNGLSELCVCLWCERVVSLVLASFLYVCIRIRWCCLYPRSAKQTESKDINLSAVEFMVEVMIYVCLYVVVFLHH